MRAPAGVIAVLSCGLSTLLFAQTIDPKQPKKAAPPAAAAPAKETPPKEKAPAAKPPTPPAGLTPKSTTPPAKQPALKPPTGVKGTEQPKSSTGAVPAQSTPAVQPKREQKEPPQRKSITPPGSPAQGTPLEKPKLEKGNTSKLNAPASNPGTAPSATVKSGKGTETDGPKKKLSTSSPDNARVKSAVGRAAPRTAPAPKTPVSEHVLQLLPATETAKGTGTAKKSGAPSSAAAGAAAGPAPAAMLPVPTGSHMAAMTHQDVKTVGTAAMTAFDGSLANMPHGESWHKHLQTDEVRKALTSNTPPDAATRKKLRAISDSFDKVGSDPRYRAVHESWGFQTLHSSVRDLAMEPVERAQIRVNSRSGQLQNELTAARGGAGWARYLRLDELGSLQVSPALAAGTQAGVPGAATFGITSAASGVLVLPQLRFILTRFNTVADDQRYSGIAQMPGFQDTYSALQGLDNEMMSQPPELLIPDLAIAAATWGDDNAILYFDVANWSPAAAPGNTTLEIRTPIRTCTPLFGCPGTHLDSFGPNEERWYHIVLTPAERALVNKFIAAKIRSPFARVRVVYSDYELTQANNEIPVQVGKSVDRRPKPAGGRTAVPVPERPIKLVPPRSTENVPVPDDESLDRMARQGNGLDDPREQVGLNPQPEPPSAPADTAVAGSQPPLPPPPADLVGLNPQPEPPSRPRDLVGLNPQPEPPSRPRDLVGLNPQPEPPSRPRDLVGLNPQPEPPGTPRDFLLALGTIPRRPANLPEAEGKLADSVVAAMRDGDADRLDAAWREMRSAATGYNADWAAIRNTLLRQAFVDSNEDLAAYAESRKGNIAVRQEIQAHLGELAALHGEMDADSSVSVETIDKITPSVGGRKPTLIWKSKRLGPDELATHMERLQEQRDQLGDLNEMEQLRLQQMMDRNSKLMQTLSNIMKKLSDTEASIIQNIK